LRVNINKPNEKQKKIVREEVMKEFKKQIETYNHDAAIQVLHILHFDYGFGQSRLQKFADKLKKMQTEQEQRYELGESETPWICENQLRNSGIDVDKILMG
jgi:hypothetical protein